MATRSRLLALLLPVLLGLAAVPALAKPIVIIVEETNQLAPDSAGLRREDAGVARVLGSDAAYVVPFRNRSGRPIETGRDLAGNGGAAIDEVRTGIETVIKGFNPGVPFVIVSEGWASVATVLALGGGSMDGAGAQAPAGGWQGVPAPYQSVQHLITIDSPLGGSSMEGIRLRQARPDGLRRWTNLYDPDIGGSGPIPEAANMIVRDEDSLLRLLSAPGHAPDIIEVVAELYRETEGDRRLDSLLSEAFDIGLRTAPQDSVPPRPAADPAPEADKPGQHAGNAGTAGDRADAREETTPGFAGLNLTGGGTPDKRPENAPAGAPDTPQDPDWEGALAVAVHTQPDPAPGAPRPAMAGRIVFFGHELASGDLDDAGRPAVLDADHVVIVVEYEDGSTEILDRADALPVLRARGFLAGTSLVLTPKGRRGYDTAPAAPAPTQAAARAAHPEPAVPPQAEPEDRRNVWLMRNVEVWQDSQTHREFRVIDYGIFYCDQQKCPDTASLAHAYIDWTRNPADGVGYCDYGMRTYPAECSGSRFQFANGDPQRFRGCHTKGLTEYVGGPFEQEAQAIDFLEAKLGKLNGQLACK